MEHSTHTHGIDDAVLQSSDNFNLPRWQRYMSNVSYLSVIERYLGFKFAIHQFLVSILSRINEEPMFHSNETQRRPKDSV